MPDTLQIPPAALPVSALRAPFEPDEPAHAETPSLDDDALCERLVPLLSAAIARKARQRRYAP